MLWGFFSLQNNLGGLIKVVSIRVRNVSYFCSLSFLCAGSQQLFQTHFPCLPPLPVLLHSLQRLLQLLPLYLQLPPFHDLSLHCHSTAGYCEPGCLPCCGGTDKLRAPLWLMPVPALACPPFQAHVIVLVLAEPQALSEEELKRDRNTA